uniref:Protein odr-4 homolog n=1 Tax=Parastrongyloides trichosuri TaxID=131310 RepID=A0A0N4Z6N1_PARTI
MILDEKIEDKIEKYLKNGEDSYVVLIGLVSPDHCHVITNVAKIKEPEMESNSKMDSNWLSEYAYQFNLRLPGGFAILGFGIVTKNNSLKKDDCLTKSIQKYYKRLPKFEKLFIKENLVTVIFENSQILGKIINGTIGSKINENIKYEKVSLCTVKCPINFTRDFYVSKGVTFFEKCSEEFDELTTILLSNTTFLKNSKIGDLNERVKNNSTVYLFLSDYHNKDQIIKNGMFLHHMILNIDMNLECKVYHSETFETAILGLKLSLLRSIFARLDLYSVSIELVTSIPEDSVQYHQLPKMITLSNNSGECLIDYAEDNEGILEIVNEIKLLLGEYSLDKTIIESDKERFLEDSEIDSMNDMITKNTLPVSSMNNNLLFLTFFVIFIAILLYPLYKYLL